MRHTVVGGIVVSVRLSLVSSLSMLLQYYSSVHGAVSAVETEIPSDIDLDKLTLTYFAVMREKKGSILWRKNLNLEIKSVCTWASKVLSTFNVYNIIIFIWSCYNNKKIIERNKKFLLVSAISTPSLPNAGPHTQYCLTDTLLAPNTQQSTLNSTLEHFEIFLK